MCVSTDFEVNPLTTKEAHIQKKKNFFFILADNKKPYIFLEYKTITYIRWPDCF